MDGRNCAQPRARVNELLTIGRAAAVLGVCPATLRNWDRQGKLKPLRHPLNGYRLYRPEDLRRVTAAIPQVAGASGGAR